jgi:hypothetical protein
MDMAFDLEARIQWVKDNPEIFASYGTSAGLIIERIAAGDRFCDEHGYDYIDSDLGKVEVKSTCVPQGKSLRIQSYVNKWGLFDHLQIIDGYNNRVFIVDHDTWFDYVDRNDMFWWSATYNESDKTQKGNTEFLLQYEVEV